MKRALIGLIAAATVLSGTATGAQTAREVRGPAPVVPLAGQPPAKIIVDPPLAEALSHGRVVIQYRTENLRIAPVFGPNAVDVSPRIGHIHKIWIQLMDANHRPLDQAVVAFVIPEEAPPGPQGVEGGSEHNPPT